jgi:hypothetical protein
MIAGTIETRARNTTCSKNSRHWNGGLKMASTVSKHIARKPPMGLIAADAELSAIPTSHPGYPPTGPAGVVVIRKIAHRGLGEAAARLAVMAGQRPSFPADRGNMR